MEQVTEIREPYGKIVAHGVSEDDYMVHYAEERHEWARGYVIKMAPIHLRHDQLLSYLRDFFQFYFVLSRQVAKIAGDPFVMRLPAAESRREPDLQIILGDNLQNLHETYMDGPADICIEVVSPSNSEVDYGDKLNEYEKGGVGEYWLLDPARRAAFFFRQQESGGYLSVSSDAEGNYETARLPRFVLNVPTLWQDQLPDITQIMEAVQTMLTD